MTDLLVKLFIKNKEQTSDVKVRTAYGMMTSIVGIICNLLLFIIKLSIGIVINSITVMADAFNNLSDMASSVIGLVGVKLASRPADREHPFGHGRYEYISALAVAFLIFQVGFSCLKTALEKIFHPEETKFSVLLLVILTLSVLIKAWLALFNKKLGKRIESNVMKATAADAKGDVMITLATVVSLIIGKITGLKIDGYMGAIVSVFVLISGFQIAKDTLEPLLGEAVDKDTFELITKKVMSYPLIQGTHDLVVHNYGPSHMMATVHCEVPNNISMEAAHEVIDQIERDVLRELNIFLVIHMDPIEVNDSIVNQMKERIVELIEELEPKATIHDFRVVNGDQHMNLIFDLVLPHRYAEKKKQELIQTIHENVYKMDPRYACIITAECSFIDMSK